MVLISERTKPTGTKPQLPLREEAWQRAQIIERLEGRYEAQEVPFGVVYRWCPENLILECECGEIMMISTSSTLICSRCGVNHTANLRAEPAAERSGDKVLHPWRYAGDRDETGL